MKKMAFIYLPFVSPMMPPLGIPMLTAFLNENGVITQSYDLNVELYRFLLRKDNVVEGFRFIKNSIKDTYYNLDKKDNIKKLSYIIKEKYILNNIDEANKNLSIKGNIKSQKELFITSQIISTALEVSTSRLNYLDNTNPSFFIFEKEFAEYNSIFRDESWGKIKEWIYKRIDDICLNSEYICFSICYDNQIYFFLFIAEYIKRKYTNKKVIIGGPAISAIIKDMTINFDKNFLNIYSHLIDYAILGDGEYPLIDIVLDRYNKNIFTSPFENIKIEEGNVDIPPLLTPNFYDLPLELYFTPQLVLPMITSRHCYWGKCRFCTHSVGYNKYVKYDSVDVIKCLKKIIEDYNVKKFYFVDECMPPIIAHDISNWINNMGLDITWMTDMRFEKQLTDDEFVKQLFNGGCRYIAFGMESANNRVLNAMNKGTDKLTIQNVIDTLTSNNINVTLMFFFGFPTETKEEALETFEFVLNNCDKISGVGMGSFRLMPGSYVYHNYKEFGITNIKDNCSYENTIGLSATQAELLYKQSINIIEKNYFRGHPFYHRIYYLLQFPIIDDNDYPIGLTSYKKLKSNKKNINPNKDLKINETVLFKKTNIIENGKYEKDRIAFINLSSLKEEIYFIDEKIYIKILEFSNGNSYALDNELKEELLKLGVLKDE